MVGAESLQIPSGGLIVCLDRAGDHGDIIGLLEKQTNQQFTDLLDGSTIKKELLEAQNEQNHMAVCEVCRDF